MESKPTHTETDNLTNPICFSPGISNMDLDPDYKSPALNDDEYFTSLPPGYRFVPHDHELIVHYLNKKIRNEKLPPSPIKDVNIYKFNPENLAENYKLSGEKYMYFFTPRDRRCKNGKRPQRSAGDGYWKATGCDKPIEYNGEVVGFQKSLTFYNGCPRVARKTSWIMHEYTVVDLPPRQRANEDDMRLDNWILCRIYKNENKSTSKRQQEYTLDQIQETSNNTNQYVAERDNEPTAEGSGEDIMQFINNYDPQDFHEFQNLYNSLLVNDHNFNNFDQYTGEASMSMVPENYFLGDCDNSYCLAAHLPNCDNSYRELNGIPQMDCSEPDFAAFGALPVTNEPLLENNCDIREMDGSELLGSVI